MIFLLTFTTVRIKSWTCGLSCWKLIKYIVLWFFGLNFVLLQMDLKWLWFAVMRTKKTIFSQIMSLVSWLPLLRFYPDTSDFSCIFIYSYITFLISSKYIPGIYLILDIIQTSIITVGDDGMALSLESSQVIDYFAAEEGATLFKCWFIDDDL